MIHAWQETAPDHGDQSEDNDTKANWLPKAEEASMLVNHDKGIRSGWWMHGLCGKHVDES